MKSISLRKTNLVELWLRAKFLKKLTGYRVWKLVGRKTSAMDSKIELNKRSIKQECIPLGCVASALYRTGGGFCPGVSVQGVSVQGLGGSSVRGLEVSVQGWGSLSTGVSVRETPSPVNRMTDTRLWKHYLTPNFICGWLKCVCMFLPSSEWYFLPVEEFGIVR